MPGRAALNFAECDALAEELKATKNHEIAGPCRPKVRSKLGNFQPQKYEDFFFEK